MDMHEKDEQLLRSFCDDRDLKDVTFESYATAIGLYSRYHKKPFYQLLKEAENPKWHKSEDCQQPVRRSKTTPAASLWKWAICYWTGNSW